MDFLRRFEVVLDCARGRWTGRSGVWRSFERKKKAPLSDFLNLEPSAGISDLEEYESQMLREFLEDMKTLKTKPVFDLVKHKIDVQDAQPVKQHFRRYSPKMLEIAVAETNKWLEEGIIEESESPWSSYPVMVQKANGDYRMYIDFREVNKLTRKDAYALPHMDSILDKLRRAKYVSKIDLSSAYLHVPMEESSKEITAFSIPGKGLFQFKRMPFGLSNAPATFQRVMDRVIKIEWEPNVFAYLDDIIIATESFEEHLYWLGLVLKRLAEVGLQINREKSEFCCSEVKYLGYVLNREGLKADMSKVEPILEFPTPTKPKQIRRFLGMVGWYSRFIDGFARIKVPLTSLLCKDVPWHWDKEQEEAFQALKVILTHTPVLARPDFSKPFILSTDASNYAIGGVLSQNFDGDEHPICFVSRVLTRSERNYTVTEKECLAVIWCIDKLRPYLQGYEFTVITDHSSLRWLNSLKDPAGRLARWATALQAYNFEIVYRKGALHHVPDALSRACEDEFVVAVEAESIKDDWYKRRIHHVEKFPSRFPDWKAEGNLLFVNKKNPDSDPIIEDLDSWKLVVPEKDRERVLFEAHDPPEAGHLGVEKTYQRLIQKYYWPGIFRDCGRYVQNCVECQLHKIPRQGKAGLMGVRNIDGPWSVVTGDIMGPFPTSHTQSKYLIMFVDSFTKYVEIKPLASANGPSVIKAFEELIVFRWGCPSVFHCDNGTEFYNKLVTDRLKEYGIHQSTIPIYHAQANPTERSNATLKTMIRIFVDGDHRSWDLHLQEFAFAINTMRQESTRYSPAFLNFGRNPKPPRTLFSQVNQGFPTRKLTQEEWSNRLKRLTAIHDLVRHNLDLARAKQEKQYNKGKREVVYKVGDEVLRRNYALSDGNNYFAGGLAPKFRGPCVVQRILSPLVYELYDHSCARTVKVHTKDMLPFKNDRGTNLKHFIFSSAQHGTEKKRGRPKKSSCPAGRRRDSSSSSATRGGEGEGPRETEEGVCPKNGSKAEEEGSSTPRVQNRIRPMSRTVKKSLPLLRGSNPPVLPRKRGRPRKQPARS